MNRIFVFSLFLLFSGCSFLINRIDSPIIDSEAYKNKIPAKKSFCSTELNPTFQLVGTNNYAQEAYLELFTDYSYAKFDFIDHFALWSLAQLSIRPDQSSATSRLQTLIKYQGNNYYFDFFSSENKDQFPYLYGIEWILKHFQKDKKLEFYAQILEQKLNQNLKLDKALEDFLSQYQKEIKSNPQIAAYFMRGNEILKENETVPLLKYSEIIKLYRQAENIQKITLNNSLTDFNIKGLKGSCNYDFNLYDNSIFLIDKISPVANLYGLEHRNGSFLSSSSQKITQISSLKGLPLFEGESKVRSSAVCALDKEGGHIWTISTQSRDPGQHLFHLFKYGLMDAKSTADVDKLLRHSRHLFLSDPVRLIFESARSGPDQIQNLLKLNLPVYNADTLGNIWAHSDLNGQGRFIIDDRNLGSFLCK